MISRPGDMVLSFGWEADDQTKPLKPTFSSKRALCMIGRPVQLLWSGSAGHLKI